MVGLSALFAKMNKTQESEDGDGEAEQQHPKHKSA